MSLKLNSIPREIFDANGTFDSKIRVNGKDISRKSIVASGRLVVCEYIGGLLNACKMNLEKYHSRLPEMGIDYATYSKAHSDKKFLFCAAQAYKAVGKDAPATVAEAKRDASLAKDPVFLRTMAAIDRDIIDPVFFRVFDDVSATGLMEWSECPLGGTVEIDIRSNDVFLFEDSAWGSGRSTTKNYLYGKTITMTPKMYSCNATVKWYQDIVNGEAGRYYAAIMNGMWNKIYARFVSALTQAANGNTYIPSALKANTYTTQNWLTITNKVAAVNGVRREDLVAYGLATALSAVVPVDGNGGAIMGMQYGLGEQWFMNGYLPRAGAVSLVEVMPAIVPGTQNTTVSEIPFGDNIYIAAKGARAPIHGCFAEGNPITLTISPSETADFTIDLSVGAMFDVVPVFGDKIGMISSVYPPAA